MSPVVAGAILMVLAAFGFSGMNALVRLAAGELHPFQVAFLRFFFGACFLVPWLIRLGGWRSQRTRFAHTASLRDDGNGSALVFVA